MIYTLLALENVGPGRFLGLQPEDKLRPFDPDGFEVEADSIEEALEVLFEIGNLDTPDRNGKVWPHRTRRSLSVGDVAFAARLEPVATIDAPGMAAVLVEAGAYVCDRVGWVELTAYQKEVEALLASDLPIN